MTQESQDSNLKLFVWKDVLCNYTCGMIVALAHDEQEAYQLVRKASEEQWGACRLADFTVEQCQEHTPLIFTAPTACYVWGGE